jgi:tRNA(fMet)-specific endonuclease VapC
VSRWLLDTNILSDAARNPQGRAAKTIGEIPDAAICTSIIVACELRFGAVKNRAMRLLAQIETILEQIEVVPLEMGTDLHYATLRADLERKGTPISANDMLIAAHALALDCILVTDNTREFARIEGLKLENWLR